LINCNWHANDYAKLTNFPVGFEVQGSRFKVQGSRFKVQSSRFKVQGSKFKVQSSRFKVQGSNPDSYRDRVE